MCLVFCTYRIKRVDARNYNLIFVIYNHKKLNTERTRYVVVKNGISSCDELLKVCLLLLRVARRQALACTRL